MDEAKLQEIEVRANAARTRVIAQGETLDGGRRLATAVVSLDRVMREVEALPLPGDAVGGEP